MWERLIQAVDRLHITNKPPSEFAWGTEFLTTEPVVNPKAFIKTFTDNNLANSHSFFAVQQRGNYELKGNLLSFPAPITYPHQGELNSRTYAHVYPSRGSKRAIIVVPHWSASPSSYVSLCKALAYLGFTTVRLSLPYHQERGVGDWQSINGMVTANLGRTIQAVRQTVVEIRALAQWLSSVGYEKVGVFGSSIGSCCAIIADIHEPIITSLFAAHMSSYFGDVVWTGESTRHIQAALAGRVTRDELRYFWQLNSPLPFIRLLMGTNPNHFIMAGKYDRTFFSTLPNLYLRSIKNIKYRLYIRFCQQVILPFAMGRLSTIHLVRHLSIFELHYEVPAQTLCLNPRQVSEKIDI